jgi:hypothetical protein
MQIIFNTKGKEMRKLLAFILIPSLFASYPTAPIVPDAPATFDEIDLNTLLIRKKDTYLDNLDGQIQMFETKLFLVGREQRLMSTLGLKEAPRKNEILFRLHQLTLTYREKVANLNRIRTNYLLASIEEEI